MAKNYYMETMIKKLLAAIMAAMFLLCGCVKEVQQPEPEHEELHEVVFHAGWDAETKTVLQEDGRIFWSPGDEISLFVGDGQNYKLTSTNTEPSAEVDFVGTIGDISGTHNFVAVYPYLPGTDVSYDYDRVMMVTPNSQIAQEGSFDSKTFVSVAVSDNDRLYFRDVCGGIKFSVANEGIDKITVKANGGETIAGKLAFSISSLDVNQNVWFAECDPSSSVEITAPGDGTFYPGSYYYAVIPAMDYSLGFTISYHRENEVATFADYTPMTIKRSTFKRLFNKDAELRFNQMYNTVANLPMPILPDNVDKTIITEAHFYVNSHKITEITIGDTREGYEPVYFEQEGSVVNYYTKGDVYIIPAASSMFEGWKSLKTLDLSTFNTDNVHGFSQMFYGCNSLEELNVSSFNTENSMWFENMFNGCVSLRELDVTNFDTSSAIDMYGMFENCCSLTTLDVSHFNTGAVTDFARMFCDCKGLLRIDVSGFDMSSAENIGEMFHGLMVKTIDLSKLNTSNVKRACGMFGGCWNLKEVNLSHFDTRNVEDLSYMFSQCRSLERVDISDFDLSNVVGIDGLFQGCHSLNDVKMPDTPTYKLKYMQYMFENCSSLEHIDLSSFDTGNVEIMRQMFAWCSKLKTINLTSFNTENVRDMSFMFHGCRNLESLDISGFESSNLIEAYNMFYDTYKLTSLNLGDFNMSGATIDGSGWWMGEYTKQCHIRCTNATKEALIASSSKLGSAKYIWHTDGSALPNVSFGREEGLYYSSDFSKDKTVRSIQRATSGSGIDIVLMGDAYSDRLIADGTYDRDMERAVDAIFAVEPFRSFKHLFNIYIVYAVSENEVIGKSTALGCFDNRPIGSEDWSWQSYYFCAARNSYPGSISPIILLHSDKMSDGAVTGFIESTTGDYMSDPLRDDYHGGYSEAVAYILGHDDRFDYTVRHEFGHSFGLLMDEYVSTGEGFGGFDWEFCFAYGLWKNVDLVSDNSVKWAKFINDPRYAGTGIGVYEGAYLPTGMWRSSPESIMNSTDSGFNAPSREAIYYRIHKLAFGKDWQFDYETFVQWDQKNIEADKASMTTPMARQSRRSSVNNRTPILKSTKVKGPDGKERIQIIMN